MKKKLFVGFVVLCVLGLCFLPSCREKKDSGLSVVEDLVDSVEFIPEPLTMYGIPVDSFVVEKAKVKKGEFLANILLRHGIDYPTIDRLSSNYKDILDVRYIKVGGKYNLFFSSDSDTSRKLNYWVYEKSHKSYVVCDFRDSLRVFAGVKPTVYKRKETAGTISSSLWNSLNEIGAHPMLSVELSNIYAWTVDFFGIAKGDAFKLIYEEEYVDSVSLGEFRIIAAEFTHAKEKIVAIPFMVDSVVGYYQQDGKNLRKAFLKAPLRYSRISSHFTNSRFHPVLKRYRAHHGVDYAAPSGTPVYSIGDGTVTARAYQPRGGGNYIKIKHNAVYTTTYMHLLRFAKGLRVGQRVHQGQLIGYVGSTGLSTGPHLDFRVHKNGSPINPLKMESPPAKSIEEGDLDRFNLKRDELQALMDAMPATGHKIISVREDE